MAGLVFAVAGDPHPLAFILPGEPRRNAALARLGDTLDQRPVDLPRRAGPEGRRELRGGETGLGDKQHARGIAVKAMDEAGLLAFAVAEGFEHGVEMARQAGAALHRKAGWLVEDENIVVLVKEDGAQEFRIAFL